MALGDYGIREIELAVELKRAGLNGQGAGGGAGLCGFVDNANPDAESGQPKRQHQTGWAGTDDQNVRLRHLVLHVRASEFAKRLKDLQRSGAYP